LYDCKLECQLKYGTGYMAILHKQDCYRMCRRGLDTAIKERVELDLKNVVNGDFGDIYKKIGSTGPEETPKS
jgi:hypothetical protein